MKFLIVVPKYVIKKGEYYNFPLGLAYISSSLKNAGYDVDCLNLNHYDEPPDTLLEREVLEKNIDVICTGGLTGDFNKIKLISHIIRNMKKHVIYIIGGGIISSEPQLIFEALDADFGVLGEGEETIVELAGALCNSKNLDNINGIIYKHNDKIVVTHPRGPIENIDIIPYPDYDGFMIDEYLNNQLPDDQFSMYPFDKPRLIPMISSRSCPYLCTFCYHPLGNKYRQRTLDNFFAELDYITKKYDINILTIYDELFSENKKRIEDFCTRIKKYNLKWIVTLRVNKVDRDMLNNLHDAGCIIAGYGLESTSDNILKSMKKNTTFSEVEKALKLTCEAKIGVFGNFIIGDKSETIDTGRNTFEWWKKHAKYQLTISPMYLYPGSELYKEALARELIKDRLKYIEHGCLPINITKMSDFDFRQILSLTEDYDFNLFPAQLLSCKKMRKDKIRGELYKLKVICPHCKEEIDYTNISSNNQSIKLGCKKCNQRFDLTNFIRKKMKKLNLRINHIIKNIKPCRLSIWGGGAHTKWLLKFTSLSANNIACIFDNNPLKHGMKIDGIEIKSLSENPEDLKKDIDAIIISSEASEDEIYKQILFLEEYNIQIYKLYDQK